MDALKKIATTMAGAALPAAKTAFKNLDPQYEFNYRVKSYAKDSRYHISSSVTLDVSLDLPGDTDHILADMGGKIDLGKSSSPSESPESPTP
jgi:hypothetical protein